MPDFRETNDLVVAPRRRSAGNPLGAAATAWLAQLPQPVQPRETAARFPHIVSKLATLWQSPEVCRAYFNELLLDERGDRKGFPNRVARELVALLYHYDTIVHPTPVAPWVRVDAHPFS